MICQSCGVEAPTKYVAFYQNIGMLVMRTHRLENNEDFPSIAADVSRLTGVTPGQVAIYVHAVVNSAPAAQ